MLRYVIKPYTSLDKYKEVDFKKKRSHSADGRAVGFWSERQRGESRGPPSPPLPSAAAAPARTARRRRGAAGRPRDGPAAIISRGHGQRRASPGGQPQGPAAARRERERERGREGRRRGRKREGRKGTTGQCLPVSFSLCSRQDSSLFTPSLLGKEKGKKKINTATYGPSATKLNFNIYIYIYNCSRSHSS